MWFNIKRWYEMEKLHRLMHILDKLSYKAYLAENDELANIFKDKYTSVKNILNMYKVSIIKEKAKKLGIEI